MSGWAKAWRSLVEHPVLHGSCLRKALFVDMILSAAREPHRVWYKHQYIDLDVGEVCVSERDLAERYGVGRQQIRSVLGVFQNAEMLTQRLTQHSTQHVRVIRLCNYAKYQGVSAGSNPADGPAPSPTGNPALTQPQPREQEKEENKTLSLLLPSESNDGNPEYEIQGGVGGNSSPSRTMPSPQAAPARSSPNRKANGHHQPERATRLSPDWRPGDDGIAYAMGELGNDAELVNETWTSFRDFWLAKAGPGARKVSWPLTWKTWVRRTRDDLRERHARLERLQPKAARH